MQTDEMIRILAQLRDGDGSGGGADADPSGMDKTSSATPRRTRRRSAQGIRALREIQQEAGLREVGRRPRTRSVRR
jgi:hypothetical protein